MPYADPARGRARVAKYHRDNAPKINEWRRQRKAKNKAYVAEYLASHPCVDCGESDPIVLEFDHRDPSKKRFALAERARKTFSLQSIIDEIAKCDVRCANCHRRKTHAERQQ